MNDPATKKAANAAVCKPGEVYCRRIKLPLPMAEHQSCPYCFGKEADIRSADHDRFCDFEEGKDPIHFGFPET